MSLTMGYHSERLVNEYSQISARTQWHPLSGFFEKPTGRILYKGFSYCTV